MSEGISRRNLIAAAVAGGAVAACVAGDDSGNNTHTRTCDQLGGKDAGESPPADWQTGYDPQIIAILYLRLENDWKITVNHACYEFASKDPAERLKKAREILSKKIQLTKPGADVLFGDKALTDVYMPYTHVMNNVGHQSGHPRDSVNFEDFKFHKQNELFIFIEHPNIKMKDKYDLITFGSKLKSGKRADDNYSFFNADIVVNDDQAWPDLKGKGQMIRVQNYVTLEHGVDIKNNDQFYSMNIHFLVDGGAAGFIEMVIDPDTGNGAGNEP